MARFNGRKTDDALLRSQEHHEKPTTQIRDRFDSFKHSKASIWSCLSVFLALVVEATTRYHILLNEATGIQLPLLLVRGIGKG